MTDHKDLIERLRSGEACQDKCRVMDAASGCICAEAARALESAQEQCVEVKPLAFLIEHDDLPSKVVDFSHGDPRERSYWINDAAFIRARITPLYAEVVNDVGAIWAEATAAAYGAAAEYIAAPTHVDKELRRGRLQAPGVLARAHDAIEALTPKSARDWLADREAAIRADERERINKAVRKCADDGDISHGAAQWVIDVIHTDAIRALPIKEKDNG